MRQCNNYVITVIKRIDMSLRLNQGVIIDLNCTLQVERFLCTSAF